MSRGTRLRFLFSSSFGGGHFSAVGGTGSAPQPPRALSPRAPYALRATRLHSTTSVLAAPTLMCDFFSTLCISGARTIFLVLFLKIYFLSGPHFLLLRTHFSSCPRRNTCSCYSHHYACFCSVSTACRSPHQCCRVSGAFRLSPRVRTHLCASVPLVCD
jgi:hypothetical protein